MDLSAIQAALRERNFDGWLFTTIIIAILSPTGCSACRLD